MLLKDKTILWVDDRFETLRDELQALSRAGANVTCVTSVNAAYEACSNSPYDLVIIDLILPQADILLSPLKAIQHDAGMDSDSELYGLVLALWLVDHRPKTSFFFYSIVPDAGEWALRHRIDPDGTRFVDKADIDSWGDGFVQTVSRHILNVRQ